MIKGLFLVGIVPTLALLSSVWVYILPSWYSGAITTMLVLATCFEGYLLTSANVQ